MTTEPTGQQDQGRVALWVLAERMPTLHRTTGAVRRRPTTVTGTA